MERGQPPCPPSPVGRPWTALRVRRFPTPHPVLFASQRPNATPPRGKASPYQRENASSGGATIWGPRSHYSASMLRRSGCSPLDRGSSVSPLRCPDDRIPILGLPTRTGTGNGLRWWSRWRASGAVSLTLAVRLGGCQHVLAGLRSVGPVGHDKSRLGAVIWLGVI